jgi:hypothetical protein
MERSAVTIGRELAQKQPKYHKVALLSGNAGQLPALGQALRQFASEEVREVSVWLNVERFRAPSSTHPPYRALARIEAHNITANRVTQSETEGRDLTQAWAEYGWQTHVEAILDASEATIASRLREREIDLLVCEDASETARLGAKAAALAACPLFLVPRNGAGSDGVSGERGDIRKQGGRLIGASQG